MAVRDLMEHGRTQEIFYTVHNEGQSANSKPKASIFMKNCSLRKFHSFTDLVVKNQLNIVPVIAVDYSLANLTFDENCYCLHTLKPGQRNDYLEVLDHVQSVFQHFSQFSLGYGFGARTVPGEGPSSDLVAMTGNLSHPFIGNSQLL